ncbi:MAG: hypothetical protein DCC75_07155 [Proteobacteria bacterium]|nr:MAG: hypothetical protein DCC75_07155 [Pseudomonadota bacterium]
MAEDTAIEMFVGGLMMDPNTQAPVVVLKDESGELILPIWIGIAEATSIASAIRQLNMARPLTHDLMHNIFLELGAKVDRVVITELRESTYFAELVVSVGDRAMIFDSRPSDAIAVALRESAPIFVAQQVIEQAKLTFSAAGQQMPEQGGVEGEEQGEEASAGPKDLKNIDKEKWEEILSNLDPEDFKYKM